MAAAETQTLKFPNVPAAEGKDKNLPVEPVHVHIRKHQLDNNIQKLVRHACSHGTTDDASKTRVVKMQRRRGDVTNPLVNACLTAFDSHLPLTLRPQFFWLAICQGVALHVQQNAEKLRDKFVSHQGKLELKLDVTLEALQGFTTEMWEGTVSSFDGMLKQHTKEGVVDRLGCSDFSDSTVAENISSMMTCMDVLKSYFDYKMYTRCGFPSVTLEGTVDDWKLLKTKAEDVITSSTLPDLKKYWWAALKDTLDRLIKAREGEANEDFWNSLVKMDGTHGSGAKTWVNGWINVFFPLAADGKPNPFCKPYKKGLLKDTGFDKSNPSPLGGFSSKRKEQYGLETADFPNGLSSCPVTLDGHLLDFQSGFVGVEQDNKTGAIKPCVGWVVASGACPRSGKYGNPDEKQAKAIITNVGVAIPLLDFVKEPRSSNY